MASLTYELTLAGLAVGSAAALTGIGLIVTYRATGVLNLAHGAVAMVCAYVLRQLVVVWGWPLPLGALVTLLLVAPALGLALDRGVFRPLALRGSPPAQALVATIGVFVLLVGGAVLLWGPGARDDAPVLLGDDPWAQLAAVVALACLVGAVTRWTRFGRELRAVVDNRPLAVLAGIDADRVAAAGWAFGSFTAGLTGVLLAPYVRLDPYGMPLLVVEVIAVAVIARMRSLPVAVAAALAIGVAQAQLTRLHPRGWGEPLLQAVGANLFVVALLVAALVLPGVGGKGEDALPPPARPTRVPPALWLVVGVLFLLPLGLAGSDLHTAVQVPALAVILLSLVVVAGRGGQIALGQAAYAGLGALLTALLAAAGVPTLLALGLAVPMVAVAGLMTGRPAIRRHGLALALATLAVGVAVSRFVLTQPYATAGLTLGRPAGFTDDRAFYALELVVLAGCLALVAALRRGRTGRALAALRDHEPGAEAAGVRVPRLKLLAFVLGAALAALGGGLLGMGLRAFDPEQYDPVRGLLWFAAVLVLGADSLLTPPAAAALLVTLDAGPQAGTAAALTGLLATLTGRLPPLLPALFRPPPRPSGAPDELPAPASDAPPDTDPADPSATDPGGPFAAGPDRPFLADPGKRFAADLGGLPGAVPEGSPGSGPSGPPGAGPTEPPGIPGGPPAAGRGGPLSSDPGSPPAADPAGPLAARPGGPPDSVPGRPAPAGPDEPPGAGPDSSPATGPGGPLGAALGRLPTAGPDRPPGTDPGGPRAIGSGGPPGAGRGEPPGSGPGGSPGAPGGPRGAARGGPPGADPDGPSAVGPEGLPGAVPDGPSGAGPGEPLRAGPGEPSGSARAEAHGAGPAGGRRHGRAAAGPAEDRGRRPHRRPAVDGARPPTEGPAPPPTTRTGLRAHDLTLTYPGGVTALSHVSLALSPARVTALVGPNGAGKSTLFDCLAGTLRPRRGQGRITLDGTDITDRSAHARARLGIARTFQRLAVFPSLTVEENVRLGQEQGGGLGDPAAVERSLRLLGLAGPVRHRAAADLPTGTLRRVELARALAGRPHTLLLDEPAAGLDATETAALARILAALAADGLTVLVVEHDPDLVAGIAHTVHTMEGGRILS
ncbi:ATP-binding cassette domain-containing protein [Streptomyces litmocidini]|uniref:ATP-binding cassette domain-containing protein n=1 Tax=Streptomyces litmocidini TaxID=67318 RepID=A0ABW7U8L9_9ACTN